MGHKRVIAQAPQWRADCYMNCPIAAIAWSYGAREPVRCVCARAGSLEYPGRQAASGLRY
jgi:hypothetical protein